MWGLLFGWHQQNPSGKVASHSSRGWGLLRFLLFLNHSSSPSGPAEESRCHPADGGGWGKAGIGCWWDLWSGGLSVVHHVCAWRAQTQRSRGFAACHPRCQARSWHDLRDSSPKEQKTDSVTVPVLPERETEAQRRSVNSSAGPGQRGTELGSRLDLREPKAQEQLQSVREEASRRPF